MKKVGAFFIFKSGVNSERLKHYEQIQEKNKKKSEIINKQMDIVSGPVISSDDIIDRMRNSDL